MPELPEVETVMRGMEAALSGRIVADVAVRRAGLRVPFPKTLKKDLEGRRAVHFSRRAKYILMRVEDHSPLDPPARGGRGAQREGGSEAARTVIIHLGMSGRILLTAPKIGYKPGKHDHLVVRFDDDSYLVFNDPRRFGMVLLGRASEMEEHPALAGLGPEPLGNEFSALVLAESLAGKKTSIKAALLDQRVVAGLGNIYVSEALFHAGIHPERIAATITAAEAERLVPAIRKVLDAAITAGGSTLRDYRHADGALGYFQNQFAVYDRDGQACPGCTCRVDRTDGIQKIQQSGRSTYFCPQRQA